MKLKILSGAVIALCFVTGINSYAAEQKVTGRGNVDGFVRFFSEDVFYLENEVRSLISECGRELDL